MVKRRRPVIAVRLTRMQPELRDVSVTRPPSKFSLVTSRISVMSSCMASSSIGIGSTKFGSALQNFTDQPYRGSSAIQIHSVQAS